MVQGKNPDDLKSMVWGPTMVTNHGIKGVLQPGGMRNKPYLVSKNQF